MNALRRLLMGVLIAALAMPAPLPAHAEPQARPWLEIINSWARDRLFAAYGGFGPNCQNAQVTGVINAVNALALPKSHPNATTARAAVAVAEMHAFAYQRGLTTSPACALSAVERILTAVLAQYDKWGQVWLSTTPINELLITSRLVWPLLSAPLRAQVLARMTQEADFWADQYERVRAAPAGFDVDDAVIGTPPEPQSPNWMLLGSIEGNTRYLGDSKAEENSMTALFLRHAYLFVSDETNARWGEISKCFLFYAMAVNETPSATACSLPVPVALRTVSDSLQLSNHAADASSPNWNKPNPQYASVALYHIAMANAVLPFGGLEWHNLDAPGKMLQSAFWAVNMNACGFNTPAFAVPSTCAPGVQGFRHIHAMLPMMMWVHDPAADPQVQAEFQRLLNYHNTPDASGKASIDLFFTATSADTDPAKISGQIERFFYPVVRYGWGSDPSFLQRDVQLTERAWMAFLMR